MVKKTNKKLPLKKISIVILEDVPIIVSAMKLELDKSDILICSVKDNVDDFLRDIKKHKPDIAFIDLRIEQDFASGFTAIESAKGLSPRTKFMIFTGYDNLPEFERAINLGVKAFITKNLHQKPLDEIVRIVYGGGAYYGELLDLYLDKLNVKTEDREAEKNEKDLETLLTKRELEVLSLLNEGLIVKEVAMRMSVEVNTIKAHTQRIREKLDVKTTKEAVRVYVLHMARKSN